MTQLFEMLFHQWCPPPNPERIPQHLRNDPAKAYGQYAFEKGFKLGMGLAVLCLNPSELADME